jgi:glycosyltransferase involved in cell wall biosynthesis
MQAARRACPDALLVGNQQGEQLARHYASMDLFLFPSLTETWGNVVGEALASGLPVVAFRRAAAAELIDDGAQGRVVAVDGPDAEQAFIAAAVSLALDEHRLLVMGHHAARSMQAHDWGSVSDSFYQWLQSSLQEAPKHESRSQSISRLARLDRKA